MSDDSVVVLNVEGLPAMEGQVERVTFSDGTMLDTPPGVFRSEERVRLAALPAAEGEAHADRLPFDPTGCRYACYGCVYERRDGRVYSSFGGLLMRSRQEVVRGCDDWFYLQVLPA